MVSKKSDINMVETPLMKQYLSIKRNHPDAILLFRVGDFYETFGQDAIKTSEILGITLTRRANGAASYVELAGFPHHALDTYLPKLVRAGQKVAICEQLEDPKKTKKIVKRGITELVTPGVAYNDNILEHKENNFLACVYINKSFGGVAFLDISTGEFYASEGNIDYLDKLINNFKPKEILVERTKHKEFIEHFGGRHYITNLDEWAFNEEAAREKLTKHFKTQSLKGFGIDTLGHAITAAGAILYYLDVTQHNQIGHISSISRIDEDSFVWIDKFTSRNLELFGSINEGAKTFIEVIDKTSSPMGGRLLKRWVALPLKNIDSINDRLNVVGFLKENEDIRLSFDEKLSEIGDLERIISKAAVGRIQPREMVQLKNSLFLIEEIKKLCAESNEPTLLRIAEQLNPCSLIRERIDREIVPDAPMTLGKGQVIANGVNEELDELREILSSGKEYLINLQQRESERTGIPSLKINFNNVFGYYIEVRNTHKDKVPPEWIRKQTLVSAERYITPELKEYEEKILGAEEKIGALEQSLYQSLVHSLSEYVGSIQLNAYLIAQLDCLLSFTKCAIEYNYCRPEVKEDDVIDIKQGRHPVIEQMLPPGEQYIANDVYLDTSEHQIIIITGPNMAGKSALLRQTALITLMAQMGSFVPAEKASIGVVDKIFTRVGASDNLSLGESTFMVEMQEAASILNNISPRSLVLLDEIGRGTSTYDGISIAWAIVEYLHEHPTARAKTLFATHYHELNEMEKSFKRVKNYNVTIKEVDNQVIFLRKLVRGGSEHSFGIHVARMAGMPPSVVKRANEILSELEKSDQRQTLSKPVEDISANREGYQLSIFQLEDPVLKQIRDQIKNIDINNLTPLEALNKLNEIKRLTGL
ncbi:DNA mismatch repair protein MutS [Tenuifilum thalassicum]|uniref:DNA mismatch repair protein MutS n=1 Tax=Tenuifilum thalassicum TaxID=2590900 RepID=UPI001C7043A1|nr:DNA mismatch repair protein MutS [Tenuifilum thalassicum]